LEDALAYARKNCRRPDWDFIANDRSTIPVADDSADFVTFFSVFTHLLDEDAYRFLKEAKRVLKRDGRVVFSFLDFDCDSHWPNFLKMVAEENPNRVLNKFITRSTVARWARGVGLRIEAIYDGADKWIPLSEPIPSEDGTVLEGSVSFGQSVAVLSVFQEEAYLARYPDVRSAIQAGYFQSGAHHYDVCGFREGRVR
jgi:SAM-dependent methyltransferase